MNEEELKQKEQEIKFVQTTRLTLDKWRNRRRMAWLAMYSVLLVTYLAFFKLPIERLKVLDGVIQWFYTIMGGIVAGYMGLATFSDIKDKKDKHNG